MKTAKLNVWNDLICPYCKVNIMTPDNHELVDGTGQCPYCKEYFKVKIVKNEDAIGDNFPVTE